MTRNHVNEVSYGTLISGFCNNFAGSNTTESGIWGFITNTHA